MHNHTETQQIKSNNLIIPLHNLSKLNTQIDSLKHFIFQSINTNTLLSKHHLDTLSNQLSSSIRHVITNASALLAASPVTVTVSPTVNEHSETVELNAVELLAKHFHFCEICGKGFTRDANMRMHMRSHGERFKTREALRGGCGVREARLTATRFSCPFEGCKRNKLHKKFMPLKSVLCLRNHFKRSHCPKTHTCDRCKRKSFAVISDLKSHVKQCGGESTWKCTCGTTFSRKEKLFGHVARFEGHSPAVEVGEEEKRKTMEAAPAEGDRLPEGFFDDLEKFWV
ncbi:protein SENSITIVE TO PROTON RHIZOTOXICITY 1-like [Cicer arietinum]|uniref:Zinc finger protein STOP1 homolog n=1 Tax=Cicer arietinum TaxID=3827 RepID=A0A1S2YFK6_CICAR|nr:zinc finger protein STOP1 homolog [Cicer arietinum]